MSKPVCASEVLRNIKPEHTCYRIYITSASKRLYGVILIDGTNRPLLENEAFTVNELEAKTLGFVEGGTAMQSFEIPKHCRE